MNADTLRENIRRCKQLTTKPFGVNIMLMHPQADEFAKIVVEEGVQVVTTGAGNPGKYVPMWKAAGIKVIPVVAAAVLAKHLEPLGIDAVIAEGTESGGHPLIGLKENVIIGKLIPAGTGMKRYRNIKLHSDLVDSLEPPEPVEEAVEVVEEEKEKEVKILVKDPDVELDIAEDEEIAMTEADDDVVTIEE